MNQEELKQGAEKAVAWYRDHKKITEFAVVFVVGMIVALLVFR